MKWGSTITDTLLLISVCRCSPHYSEKKKKKHVLASESSWHQHNYHYAFVHLQLFFPHKQPRTDEPLSRWPAARNTSTRATYLFIIFVLVLLPIRISCYLSVWSAGLLPSHFGSLIAQTGLNSTEFNYNVRSERLLSSPKTHLFLQFVKDCRVKMHQTWRFLKSDIATWSTSRWKTKTRADNHEPAVYSCTAGRRRPSSRLIIVLVREINRDTNILLNLTVTAGSISSTSFHNSFSLCAAEWAGWEQRIK